jgi:hypothetical protein
MEVTMDVTMKVTLVLAHHRENLFWMGKIDRKKYPNIVLVSKTRRDADIYQSVNKGCEASAYLEYIVRNYDALDEYTLFIHAHRRSWHHTGLMEDLLNNKVVIEGMYGSINTPNLVIEVKEDHDYMTLWRDIYFGDVLEVVRPDERHRVRQAAQFYVHRDLIHRHPKAQYERWLRMIYDDALGPTKHLAIVFEFMWFPIWLGQYDEIEWERRCGRRIVV